jgi:hypothetical protein
MLFFFLDNQRSLKGSDIGLRVSEIRKRILERVLKRRDEEENVVEECEERMSLVSLLVCEYLLCNDEKRNEFLRDIMFPLSTSLLHIRHSTPQSDKTDLFLSHLFSLLRECCRDSTYRSLLCSEEGRLQFGRILSVCNERMLDETRRMSGRLFETLFETGEEREVEWIVKEGGLLAVIRRVREKEERNIGVMSAACWTAYKFLRPWDHKSIRRLRTEWKGKKEWRVMMWMMEEDGGIDSMHAVKEAYGRDYAKDVLRTLGICCPK